MSGILGPKGSPMVEFGSTRAWRVYTKGDIVCSFQWIDIGHESGEAQPCMCLYKATPSADRGVYVIPADNAHAFATNKGGATEQLLGSAFKAAVQMGFFPDRFTVKRIIDVILDAMEDLIRMPTAQPAALDLKAPTMGIEVSVKQGDRVIHEALH